MSQEESRNVFDLFTRSAGRQADAPSSSPAETGDEGHADDASATDAPPDKAGPDGAEKQPYKATLPAKAQRELRLQIHYPKWQQVRRLSYSHLNDILTTGEEWLSLIYTHTAIILRGRHLDKLADDLQDERTRALICFRPADHLPPEADDPCILEIRDALPADIAPETPA